MKVFQDTLLQSRFDEKGYVVVDFFDADEVALFLEFWKKSPHSYEKGTFTSVHMWDAALNHEFSRLMTDVSQPKINALLPGWYVQGSSYIVKGPKSEVETHFSLHQDFNMVDESDVPSFGLWVALVDTRQANGGLCALPGSHNKFGGTLRGANMASLFLDMDEEVEGIVDHIDVKAGQACIFAHSLFHGSPSNSTETERPIIHAGLFAPDSRPFHYFMTHDPDGKERIEILEIDRTYYYREILKFVADPKGSPHRLVGSVFRYRARPTRAEMLEAYGIVKAAPEPAPQPAAGKNLSENTFLHRLKNIFRKK